MLRSKSLSVLLFQPLLLLLTPSNVATIQMLVESTSATSVNSDQTTNLTAPRSMPSLAQDANHHCVLKTEEDVTSQPSTQDVQDMESMNAQALANQTTKQLHATLHQETE
jgi:hypothetical protein